MPKYILIGLLVVIGTFMIMNYWPKLKEQTKNRILMLIFGVFFISIFVLLILLMFYFKLLPLSTVMKKSVNSTIKWYIQPLTSDNVKNELRGNS